MPFVWLVFAHLIIPSVSKLVWDTSNLWDQLLLEQGTTVFKVKRKTLYGGLENRVACQEQLLCRTCFLALRVACLANPDYFTML